MTTKIVVILILKLCPNLEADSGKTIQGYKVNCMDYYVNDIYNNPSKYESQLNEIKRTRSK
jgi:hypothetical protein